MIIRRSKLINSGLFIFFVAACLCFREAFSKNENKVMLHKPNFKLEVKASGLIYFVDVNGASVLREYDSDNQIEVDIPINHWIHPEKNSFVFRVAPPKPGLPYNKNAYIEVSLKIGQNDNPDTNYHLPLLSFHSNGLLIGQETKASMDTGAYLLDNNNVKKVKDGWVKVADIEKTPSKETDNFFYDGAIEYSREVTMPNSLPLWAFFNSDTLPDYEIMSDKDYDDAVNDLFVEYKKIQDALANKKIDSIASMFLERSNEADLALYNPKGQFQRETLDMFQDDMNNPDLSLRLREAANLGITMEKNRKLVSLTLEGNVNALGFVRKNGSYVSYPLMFRRQNGKWILTR